MSTKADQKIPELDFDTPALKRHRKVRALKDRTAGIGIAIGGSSVILAVLLICFYLMYEVAPLFSGASIEQKDSYALPAAESGKSLYLTSEEQTEVGFRVAENGDMIYFNMADGRVIKKEANPLGEPTAFALESDTSRMMAFAYADGRVLVAQQVYKTTYPDGERLITPSIEFPYGTEGIQVAEFAPRHLSIRNNDERMTIAVVGDQQAQVTRVTKDVNFITEEVELTETSTEIPFVAGTHSLLISGDQRYLYVANKQGEMSEFDLRDLDDVTLKIKLILLKAMRNWCRCVTYLVSHL